MIFTGLWATAYAESAPTVANTAASSPSTESTLLQFVPILLIAFVGYFLLYRPSQQKMKQQADMISALRRGDKVVTAGGMIGTIYKIVNNEEVIVEIAEGVRIRLLKSSINQVLAKTEPVGIIKPDDIAPEDSESGDVTTSIIQPTEAEIGVVKKSKKITTRPTVSRPKKTNTKL